MLNYPLGALAAQYFLVARSPPTEIAQFEYATLFAIHLVNVFAAIALQIFQLGSSSIFTIFSLGSLFALILNTALNALGNPSRRRDPDWTTIHLATYAVAQVVPLVVGSEMAVGLLGIFVPLTGRMGEVRILLFFRTTPLKPDLLIGRPSRAYHCYHDRSARLPNCFQHNSSILTPRSPERAPPGGSRRFPFQRDYDADLCIRVSTIRCYASKTGFRFALRGCE